MLEEQVSAYKAAGRETVDEYAVLAATAVKTSAVSTVPGDVLGTG